MAFKTLSDVFGDVRFRTNTNSNSLGDSDLLRIANKYFRIIMRALVDLNQDLYCEISTFDIVANQQEYTLPADSGSTPFGGGAIKMLRLEVTYDGSIHKVLGPINWREIAGPTRTAAEINNQFNTSDPKYSFYDRSVFLFPIPTASQTAGGTMFYVKRPAEMTATSDIPNMPADFLDVLSDGITADVHENLGNTSAQRLSLDRFNGRIEVMKAQENGIDAQDVPRFTPAAINYK